MCSNRIRNSNTDKRYILLARLEYSGLEEVSASDFVKELHRKAVKNFIDILILGELKSNSVSGYDVIGLIHKRYGILLSSGTVYSMLYSLERDGLIKGTQNNRKRVYTLTETAEQKIDTILKAKKGLQYFLNTISSPDPL